ncbi:MAG: FAD-binding oxidoreductase [Phycisphaerae bacterium]|nr:FAD-binding oxidoreductase [Phycisphaerae bacterium]
MSESTADAVIIGAGIVGAACALVLSSHGVRCAVIDAGIVGGGATSAGMGHVCVIDDSEPQFALSSLSVGLWRELRDRLPRGAEFDGCGTLWIAANAAELDAAGRKAERLAARGIRAELLDGASLAQAEPRLRPGLAGGLLMPDDSVVYAPVAARWMLDQAEAAGSRVRLGGSVVSIGPSRVGLENGESISAPWIISATGVWAPQLTPGLPVRPRKGHLAISDRYPGLCRRQLVELAYITHAHGHSDESVSFNLQPRPTGQLLIGSSRQYAGHDPAVEPRVLALVLARAIDFVPALAGVHITRAWTGFRAATPDSLPIIGPHPAQPRLLLATGHEGLGLTNSLGTARLVASHMGLEPAPIDPTPFLASRFRSAIHG